MPSTRRAPIARGQIRQAFARGSITWQNAPDVRRSIRSRSESSRTRRGRSRSSDSPTPTWRGWSSATSTPKVACLAGTSNCTSRTARPPMPSAAAAGGQAGRAGRVDVILGGIYSSTRQAIKGPAVVEGRTLYIYPEQYEGEESDPLIFCTGPVPAQQVDPFIPWLMQQTGREEVLPAVGRLHLAAHDEPEGPRGRHRPRRRDRRRGVLPARSHRLPARPSSRSRRAAPRSSSTPSCRRVSGRSSSSSTTPASRSAAAISSARTSTRTS